MTTLDLRGIAQTGRLIRATDSAYGFEQATSTEAAVRRSTWQQALELSGIWIQYSTDGSTPSDTPSNSDTHFRVSSGTARPGNSSSRWSTWIALGDPNALDEAAVDARVQAAKGTATPSNTPGTPAAGTSDNWAPDDHDHGVTVSGGGLDQAAVDARVQAGVLDWAETGNNTLIPTSKIPFGDVARDTFPVRIVWAPTAAATATQLTSANARVGTTGAFVSIPAPETTASMQVVSLWVGTNDASRIRSILSGVTALTGTGNLFPNAPIALTVGGIAGLRYASGSVAVDEWQGVVTRVTITPEDLDAFVQHVIEEKVEDWAEVGNTDKIPSSKLSGVTVSTWSGTTAYDRGSIVVHSSTLWILYGADSHTSATTPPADPLNWWRLGRVQARASASSYRMGDLAIGSDDRLYICNRDGATIGTDPVNNPDDWFLFNPVRQGLQWNSARAYARGDIVLQSSNLYACLAATSTGTNPTTNGQTHWVQLGSVTFGSGAGQVATWAEGNSTTDIPFGKIETGQAQGTAPFRLGWDNDLSLGSALRTGTTGSNVQIPLPPTGADQIWVAVRVDNASDVMAISVGGFNNLNSAGYFNSAGVQVTFQSETWFRFTSRVLDELEQTILPDRNVTVRITPDNLDEHITRLADNEVQRFRREEPLIEGITLSDDEFQVLNSAGVQTNLAWPNAVVTTGVVRGALIATSSTFPTAAVANNTSITGNSLTWTLSADAWPEWRVGTGGTVNSLYLFPKADWPTSVNGFIVAAEINGTEVYSSGMFHMYTRDNITVYPGGNNSTARFWMNSIEGNDHGIASMGFAQRLQPRGNGVTLPDNLVVKLYYALGGKGDKGDKGDQGDTGPSGVGTSFIPQGAVTRAKASTKGSSTGGAIKAELSVGQYDFPFANSADDGMASGTVLAQVGQHNTLTNLAGQSNNVYFRFSTRPTSSINNTNLWSRIIAEQGSDVFSFTIWQNDSRYYVFRARFVGNDMTSGVLTRSTVIVRLLSVATFNLGSTNTATFFAGALEAQFGMVDAVSTAELAAETTARTAGDAALSTRIDGLVTTPTADDTLLDLVASTYPRDIVFTLGTRIPGGSDPGYNSGTHGMTAHGTFSETGIPTDIVTLYRVTESEVVSGVQLQNRLLVGIDEEGGSRRYQGEAIRWGGQQVTLTYLNRNANNFNEYYSDVVTTLTAAGGMVAFTIEDVQAEAHETLPWRRWVWHHAVATTTEHISNADIPATNPSTAIAPTQRATAAYADSRPGTVEGVRVFYMNDGSANANAGQTTRFVDPSTRADLDRIGSNGSNWFVRLQFNTSSNESWFSPAWTVDWRTHTEALNTDNADRVGTETFPTGHFFRLPQGLYNIRVRGSTQVDGQRSRVALMRAQSGVDDAVEEYALKETGANTTDNPLVDNSDTTFAINAQYVSVPSGGTTFYLAASVTQSGDRTFAGYLMIEQLRS